MHAAAQTRNMVLVTLHECKEKITIFFFKRMRQKYKDMHGLIYIEKNQLIKC